MDCEVGVGSLYQPQRHAKVRRYMGKVAIPPQIRKITIEPGGTLPSVKINGNDSVFWYNNTTQTFELAYTPPGSSTPVRWGTPPNKLGPKQSSSQQVFPNPKQKTSYAYKDLLSSAQGVITVFPNPPGVV